MPIKSSEASLEESALAFNMQTQCLAPVLSKAAQLNQSPWERHRKFLMDEFRLQPRYTKWNESWLVYQRSHSVYSIRSKHTGCLITLAEDISSNTYTRRPESYCMVLSEIYVKRLMFTQRWDIRPCMEVIIQIAWELFVSSFRWQFLL